MHTQFSDLTSKGILIFKPGIWELYFFLICEAITSSKWIHHIIKLPFSTFSSIRQTGCSSSHALRAQKKNMSIQFCSPIENLYSISDHNGQNLYPFSDQKSSKIILVGVAHCTPLYYNSSPQPLHPPPPLPLPPILNKTWLAWSVAGFYKPRLSPSPPELQVYLKLGQTLNSQHLLNLIKPTEKEVTTLYSTNRLIFVSRITIYTKKWQSLHH